MIGFISGIIPSITARSYVDFLVKVDVGKRCLLKYLIELSDATGKDGAYFKALIFEFGEGHDPSPDVTLLAGEAIDICVLFANLEEPYNQITNASMSKLLEYSGKHVGIVIESQTGVK